MLRITALISLRAKIISELRNYSRTAEIKKQKDCTNHNHWKDTYTIVAINLHPMKLLIPSVPVFVNF